MKDSIFTLAPERVQFDQFWIEIRKRNRWLIMLRYGAVAMLASLIIGLMILQNHSGNFRIDTEPLWLIAASILLYNIVFHRIWIVFPKVKRSKRVHSLHFSFAQICADFIALMLFIYFTGGIETPLFGFFIFHVIIGSLFLPGLIMAIIATVMLGITLTGALLELWGVIPHHGVQLLMNEPLYNNPYYLAIFFVLFAIMIYLSIYLANSIARQLYRRERALTQAYDELEEAERSKSKYVMSVVHDLKTPIAAVLTYLNMLLEGTLGELKKEHRRPLQRSKSRLTAAIDTINDVLYISQLKLDIDEGEREIIKIADIMEEIHADTRVLLNSKDIIYNYDDRTDGQDMIKGEPWLMKLALSNIISNAIKYTPDGGRIEVIVEQYEHSICIIIADSGIGIPEAEQNKIFQDFYRSSISKKKGVEGTGLGMSIVREIVHRHNGTVTVNSPSRLDSGDEMPGSEFILTFPKIS
jgi:signal transduction histidine kinase